MPWKDTIVPAKRLLYGKKKPLAGSFDFAHYCAIHRFCLKIYIRMGGQAANGGYFKERHTVLPRLRKLKAQRKPSLPD